MSMIYTCDRCKKEIKAEPHIITISTLDSDYTRLQAHLCDSCKDTIMLEVLEPKP